MIGCWRAEYAQEAVAMDNQGKYEQAFAAYMRALDQFALHCKYDKNPSSKEMIQKKMREYMDRAEYLKSVINNNTRTDDAGDGASAVGQKKKPQVYFNLVRLRLQVCATAHSCGLL
jgi:vacuolar protein-sorting-associated protein 4